MFLLIDKPRGITSHDVVDRIRKITGEKRVGHGGTLDPNATGLLVVAVGRESTKKLGKTLKGVDKVYEADVYFGEERDTDDVEGAIVSRAKGVLPPGRGEIGETLKQFLGEQSQVPPKYSSVRVKGKRAYKLARKGEFVKLKPRKIIIHSIKVLSYRYPILSIQVKVSSGTYIRALARDIGRKLGMGAYLKELRRIRIGGHSIEDAVGLEKISVKNWKQFGVHYLGSF